MASSTTLPAETCTLADFVSSGTNDDMTYRNFAILEVPDSGLELVDHNLIDDYLTELREISVLVTEITNSERVKYRYAPDLLAYDCYGSTQLDFVIMAINGVATPLEFTMKGKLYLPKNTVLKEFMSMVYNGNSEYLSINRNKYNLT